MADCFADLNDRFWPFLSKRSWSAAVLSRSNLDGRRCEPIAGIGVPRHLRTAVLQLLVLTASFPTLGQEQVAGPAPATGETSATVSTLVQQFQNPVATLRDRQAAMNSLAGMGRVAVDAIPALERELSNSRSELAYAAYQALGAIRSEPPLDQVFILASGPPIFLQRQGFGAFQAVQQGIVPKDQAIPLLREVLKTNPPRAELIMALETIRGLRPDDPETIRMLLDWLESNDKLAAWTASAGLTNALTTHAQVMDILAAALIAKDRPEKVVLEAAKVLGRYGARAAPYAPAIVQALCDGAGKTNNLWASACLHVVRQIGPDAATTAPALAGLLPETAPTYKGMESFFARNVRRDILLTLAEIGVPKEAIPTIIDELSNAWTPDMVAAAARAAGALLSDQEKVVPFLRMALARTGLGAPVSLDSLATRAPRSPVAWTSPYLEIINALVRIGPPARAAVPVLKIRAMDRVRPSAYGLPHYQQEAYKAVLILSQYNQATKSSGGL
jgi:hypothetical protein